MDDVEGDVDAEDLRPRRPEASRRRRFYRRKHSPRRKRPPPGLRLLRFEAEVVASRRRQRRELLLPPQGVRSREGTAAAATAGGADDIAQRAREAVDREAVEAHQHGRKPEVVGRRTLGRDRVRRGVDGQDSGLSSDWLLRGQRDVEDSGLEGRLRGAERPGEVVVGGGDGEESRGGGDEEEEEEERVRSHHRLFLRSLYESKLFLFLFLVVSLYLSLRGQDEGGRRGDHACAMVRLRVRATESGAKERRRITKQTSSLLRKETERNQ